MAVRANRRRSAANDAQRAAVRARVHAEAGIPTCESRSKKGMFSNLTSTLRRSLSASAPQPPTSASPGQGSTPSSLSPPHLSQTITATSKSSDPTPVKRPGKPVALPTSERLLARRQKRWAIVESKQVRTARISSALGNQAQTLSTAFSKHSSEVGSLLAEADGIGSLKASLQGSQNLLACIFPEIEELERLLVEHAGSNYKQQKRRPIDASAVSPTTSKLSGGMTKVAANIDNAFSSLSRRINSASTFNFADRNSNGLGRRGAHGQKRNVIKIRTNSEASCDDESDTGADNIDTL